MFMFVSVVCVFLKMWKEKQGLAVSVQVAKHVHLDVFLFFPLSLREHLRMTDMICKGHLVILSLAHSPNGERRSQLGRKASPS